MQHVVIVRVCALFFSLLATQLASATPVAGLHQPLLAHDTAASLRPAAPRSKAARSRPAVSTPKPSQTLAAVPRPQAERQASAVPATAPAHAPQWVTLRGVVVRPTGRPCAGASVYASPTPRQLVVTDAQGAFTLPVPAGAAVLLRVEYFGEGSSRVEVRLPGSDVLRIILGQ